MSWLFDNQFPYTDFHELNLSWLIEKYKLLLQSLQKIDGWIEEHEEEYKELKDYYDQIVSGNFPPEVQAAFENWMKKNAIDLVASLVKHVYFGLTNDGYFCAFIPENWSDIHFDSVTNFDDPLYGHLMVIYD